MLVAQATAAAALFTGKNYAHRNDALLAWLLHSFQNIVLIGMPGAGKSFTGKYLAERLRRVFVDLDDVVAENAGMYIPEIFSKYGESAFRDMETAAAKEYGKQNNLVIATGGGVVLKKENMDALMQNGVIVFIEREIDKLAADGRPLSANPADLQKMYEERLPLYQKYSAFRCFVPTLP
jgi:shikimate dehydrogenase